MAVGSDVPGVLALFIRDPVDVELVIVYGGNRAVPGVAIWANGGQRSIAYTLDDFGCSSVIVGFCAFHCTKILPPVASPWKTVVQKLHKGYNKVMLTDTGAVRTYFAKLGLENEIADLYLALHTHGPQSISELSRTSGVERTRIYRLIDRLMETNLIEVESHYKRGIIKAAPIANLHILINEREKELQGLQDELGLIEQLLARNSLSSPASRVQFYHGPQGIRQMLWNRVNAKTEVVGYSYRILDEITGRAFMERWVGAVEEKGQKARILLNDEFAKSWKENKPKVMVQRRIGGMQYHWIDEKHLKITHGCAIYDNIVAYTNWKDTDVFGVEIYNQQIADTQRQLFEQLWPLSKPETRF
jgi:sugar-specific transcriptional regulator TrmB